MDTSVDPGVRATALHALTLVEDGNRLGLGSGRAATAFVDALGRRVAQGLRVWGVASSEATAAQARALGIPLLDAAIDLDLTVDGADEVSPSLDVVKGWGGALVRERIVAAASRRQILLVGRDKLVARLGERGKIPVEVIPLASTLVMRALPALGLVPTVREGRSDNGNLTLDCAPREPLSAEAARALEVALLALPGVVDTGLFLGMAERVLVGHPDGTVEVRVRG